MKGTDIGFAAALSFVAVGALLWAFSDTPEVRAQKLAASRNHELVRTCMRGHGSPKLDAQGVLLDCDYNHKHGLTLKKE